MPVQEINYDWLVVTPIYWRRRVISANIIGLGEGEALQKMCYTFPIRHNIAY